MIFIGDDTPGRNGGLHIGLIPDGSRRHARKHGKPVWKGHQEGAKKLREFLSWCMEYPEIRTVTIFALSTENLHRPGREVSELWNLYRREFKRILRDRQVKESEIKVNILGDKTLWRPDIQNAVKAVVEATKAYSKHVLNILLAYGSKFEIKRAVDMAQKTAKGIEKHLLVTEDLDLVIRTGGQRRLSNFLLYQSSYAEIFFSDSLWPEFTREEFDRIMKWYKQQVFKFGK